MINCYRLALFDKELACNSLKIRQRKLRADLKSKYHNELQFKQWHKLFNTNHTNFYPQQLFYNYNQCHFHPAKHLVLMSYLFSSPPQNFLCHYQATNQALNAHFANNQAEFKRKRVKEHITAKILILFKGGKSLRAIAKNSWYECNSNKIESDRKW